MPSGCAATWPSPADLVAGLAGGFDPGPEPSRDLLAGHLELVPGPEVLHRDPTALGFTIVSLSVALEEALKALADKNGSQTGAWLDEVEELSLLRAKSRLTEAQEQDAASAAIAVVETIFARMRSGYSST